jgi:hypothetical protein
MTPKEKAKELVNKFKSNVYKKAFANSDFMYDRYYGLDDDMAKQCALVAVDELLEATKRYDYTLGPNPSYNDYWLKIKYQIEKL